MRNLRFRELFSSAILLIALVVSLSSCKKDDEDNSGYYGKWMAEKTVPSSFGYGGYGGYGGITKGNYYLTISGTNQFNESFFISDGVLNGQNVSIDGSVVVLDNHMQFNAEKVSFSKYNSQKQKIDPPYYVNSDGHDIEIILQTLVKVTSGHTAEFSLNGNNLIISVDYDENGDFLDYDEILTYTRQK